MELFKQYQSRINNLIQKHIVSPIENDFLKEMINHALSGGKRLRAILVLLINDSFEGDVDLSKSALAIELIHNASLIIDDMPCMDNDNYRRGKETIHFKYGLCKAQYLSAYLLEKATELIYENYNDLPDKKELYDIFVKILKNINKNMGFLGIASGQFIDICPVNPFVEKTEYKSYYDLDGLINLIHLKTTTLFEISFVLPYFYLSKSSEKEDILIKTIQYFGLAFQISDDVEDIGQDMSRNKQMEFNPNMVCRFGKEKTKEIYNDCIEHFQKNLIALKINHPVFNEIIYLLNKRMEALQ